MYIRIHNPEHLLYLSLPIFTFPSFCRCLDLFFLSIPSTSLPVFGSHFPFFSSFLIPSIFLLSFYLLSYKFFFLFFYSLPSLFTFFIPPLIFLLSSIFFLSFPLPRFAFYLSICLLFIYFSFTSSFIYFPPFVFPTLISTAHAFFSFLLGLLTNISVSLVFNTDFL